MAASSVTLLAYIPRGDELSRKEGIGESIVGDTTYRRVDLSRPASSPMWEPSIENRYFRGRSKAPCLTFTETDEMF